MNSELKSHFLDSLKLALFPSREHEDNIAKNRVIIRPVVLKNSQAKQINKKQTDQHPFL